MDISLEVLLSTSIKRKKPCPRLCWLGQEKEAVYLVDERQVSEIKLRSGNVKKTLLKKKSNIVTLATSDNGAWLATLHLSGELSLWNKDTDGLQIIPANDGISGEIASTQGCSEKLHLYVSDDGRRVLLVAHTGSVYLWENTEEKPQVMSQKKRVLPCRWSKIEQSESAVLPGVTDKEATVHAIFIKNEVLGDSCLCTFVFYSGSRLVMTFLALRWMEKDQKLHSVAPYHVHWTQQDCSVLSVAPACAPVKSRGSLLARFSRDGLVLTLALNQKDPKETCLLFINTMNFVTTCGSLRGCGSRDQLIPSRLLRSYWVADMSWTADSLFLACILKRGSLLLLTRMGELLTLTTFGCSVEFGPAEFIPLHPFITYRPPVPIPDAANPDDSLGSVRSEADVMRQRYSVTCHPRLSYVMASDGYMVTMLRVAENLSPQKFMKSLLLDTAQRLENVRQQLHIVKSKTHGPSLRTLSSLKATLLKDSWTTPSSTSHVPSFLQEEEEMCGQLEKLLAQEDSEQSDDQEYTAPADGTYSRAEHGRLEFASMFDTIHASDQYTEKGDVPSELLRIRRTILMAWAVGVSMGGVAHTGALLHYTVGCLTHFLSLLQNPKCPTLKPGKPSKKKARFDPWASYVSIFHQCLTLLYWDVAPRQTIGHVMKLTAETVRLILLQHRRLFSKNLLESFCLVKMVSQNLAAIYTSRFESISTTPTVDDAAHLDVLKAPVFQTIKQPVVLPHLQCIFKEPPNLGLENMKSEKRLAFLWRLLYHQTLLYQMQLRKKTSLRQSMQLAPEVQNEESAIGFLLCHLQAEVQSGGGHLLGTLSLLPVAGEEYFLMGSYKKAVEFWKRELQEATARGGRRCGLLQTRYYLALLYCHLYHYNLNDAQGMCDQLVRELLIRSHLLSENEEAIAAGHCLSAKHQPAGRPLKQVHPDAALAVIRSMGRFMAAYFTNQLLYVFPPHSVCVLAPLYAPTDKRPRVVPLQRGIVSGVIRDQNLSSVWTVEYTLDLLLVGGLISEAAWLADRLGDWKMSVSMSVVYNLHRSSITEEQKGEFPAMPLCLSPAHIFQEKLQSFLGHPPKSEAGIESNTSPKQFTDPIEEEDADLLFSSVQEMLKAAVMADAEILTETLQQLTESAKELGRKFSGLVPDRLYLPAPPLYCPQPSSVSEEDPSDGLLESEKHNRQKLSGILQRILLLFRAAHCSLPAAQWYIKQIKRARKIMQKIRAKASLPPLDSLPENLLNYANSRTVLLKPGPSGEPVNDLVSCSVVVCFRELCALCWMLHVRERLSISCRQYQRARDNGKLFKSADEVDSCVIEHCFEALEWACRMLLFTRATNCEELIQDLILSLISELPPVKKVAEIMVRAFPNPEDVRVPLREKYHSVQQRLRHSKIRGLHGEEMMSVIIHNMQRVRIKTLKRVQRNIGSVEMHLWEPPLDESLEDESHCYDKYSLGTTSLSRSTLTDLGRPQIYSDTDTLSDALMCTGGDDSIALGSHTGNVSKAAKKKSRKKRGMPRESGPSPPKVGTWEFECNDEEYTRFLDLFLSYLLDRDLLSGEPGIPFLSSFSSRLREHELNSLVFDVHTTLKRKLVRAGIRSVFSAGSCFTLNSENVGDSVGMEGESPQTQGAVDPTHGVSSTIILGKPITAGKKSFPNVSRRSVRSGLFGLQDHGRKKPQDNGGKLTRPSMLSPLWDEQYSYRLIQNKHCNPSEELGEELQAKYSNEAKLVEWMIRWSDRRLFWSAGRAELRHVAATTAIRVKTSSAALLTSIWLLEKPYLGNIYVQYAHIAAPVLPSEVDSNVQDRPSGAIEYLQSERSSPCTVHDPDDRSEEESASIALSKISRVSERSPERPSGLHEKSEDYASVRCDNHQSDQTLSESDDQGEESDTQRSMKIAVSIRPVLREPENLPPDSTHQSPEPEEPKIREGSQPPVPAGFTSPAPKPPVPAGFTSPAPQPSVPAGFTSPAPQPGPFLPPPAPTTDRTEPAIPNGGQTPQPVTSSEAVRQLLQDEMFRLLQLQQINFMSLMQVVGSSFAAIPALQHVLEQTAQIRSPVMNPMGERSALQVIPQAPSQNTPAEPVPDRQRATDPVRTESAGTGADKTARTEQNNKENLQKLPELHIPPGRVNAEGKIPARLGLLSTAPPHGLPLITPPSGPPKTPSLIRPPATKNHNGFPLLKLQSEPQMLPLRPPLREAWAPLRMPTPVSAHITQRIGAGDASIAPHWAEPVSRGPPAHQPSSQTAAQQFYRDKDTKGKQQIGLFGSEQSKAGIPLLHLRSDPVLYVPAPQKPSTKAPTLLHLVPDPSAILPPAKLTLLKTNLPQWVQIDDQRRDPGQNAENHQQLRANILPSEEETKAEDSIKRKNRRTLKEKKEKVASVTFRLEDSIIAPNNLDEVAPSEIVRHDKQDLEDGSEFAIPLGSFDSLLSREIPAAPILSMAEVHFLASTMKRPPEIRDASTNTDSGSVRAHKPLIDSGTKCEGFPRPGMAASHLDPEVLPSDIQEQRPPELFLNLQYPHAPQPEKMPVHFGHHMEVEEVPDSDSHDVPSSAELHLLAASVTNAQPLEYIEPTDVLEGPLSVDWAPSAVDRTTHQALSSDLTSVPIRELAPRVWTPRVRSTGAISRLQEMDAQLQALQNMADGMELDFANTKLLVNTLETLTSAVQPEPKGVSPRGAGDPQRVLPSSDLTLEDLAEEEEYDLTSPADIGLSEHPLEVLISPRAPGRPKDMDESLQDALQMTGLSDMADILGDLVAGGVSASDLGLTPAQAEKLSRMKLRGTSKKTTSERTDLLQWMKKKQRERLAEHRRRLQELREKEHKPFQTQNTTNSSLSSRTLREEQQVKDDRDRSLLMEHHSHRVSDAMGLMQELLSEAKQIPSVVHQPGTYKVSSSRRPASRPSPTGGRGAVRNVSANQEKRRLSSHGGTSQPRSRSTPAQTQIRGTATFVLPKSNWEPKARTHSAPSYSVHRRHDPSLPGDRLSQITRRGLLPTRNRINVQNKNTKPVTKAIAKQTYRQGKSSKGTSPLSQYGEFQPEDYERDIVSPWEIPDEINRILNCDRNSILSQGSMINGEADSRIRNLDNSSDSTGSILSKLDWKAIEDMVASVGSTQM